MPTTSTTPDAVASVLDKLIAGPSPRKRTKSATLADLAPRLLELRRKGWTIREIADALNASGISVSKATVQIALREAEKAKD
jgi:hypothetical protein